jgi:protein-S-isoprenylcysteine O-methyltransferase Ste14
MTTLVIALRIVSVLAVAGPMLVAMGGHRRGTGTRSGHSEGERAPLLANLAAVGLYVPSLLLFSGSPSGSAALVLAMSGVLLAAVGVAIVLRSRAELGPAWSFVPKADHEMGLVTSGPYRVVRHPIYLGLTLLGVGEALVFGSWPAFVITLLGLLPTFAWRAHAEEKLLSRTFGARYAVYRQRTRMIIPYLL